MENNNTTGVLEDTPVFYNPERLLNTKDLNNNPPYLYLTCGNRIGGKSYAYKKLLLNMFLNGGGQFLLIVRNVDEMDGAFQYGFEDMYHEFPQITEMKEESICRGLVRELYINNVLCGHSVYLSRAKKLRRYSALFEYTNAMFFDEFLPEDDEYLDDEIGKLMSVILTVCRGYGKAIRYVPLYMVSNMSTLNNPYYRALGITERLKSNTKFLRGDKWVMEKYLNENAESAILSHPLIKAFSKGTGYANYASSNDNFLDDYTYVVDKLYGERIYICTLFSEKNGYGVYYYPDRQIIYITKPCDKTYKYKFNLTSSAKEQAPEYSRSQAACSPIYRANKEGRIRYSSIEVQGDVRKWL